MKGRALGAIKCVKAAFELAVHVACFRLASLLVRNTLFISMHTGNPQFCSCRGAHRVRHRAPLLILFWALENFGLRFRRAWAALLHDDHLRAHPRRLVVNADGFRETGSFGWMASTRGSSVCAVGFDAEWGRCHEQIRRAIDGGESKFVLEEDESLQ